MLDCVRVINFLLLIIMGIWVALLLLSFQTVTDLWKYERDEFVYKFSLIIIGLLHLIVDV